MNISLRNAGALFLAAFVTAFSSASFAEAWRTTRSWTDSTEVEFGKWFTMNATADFFNNRSKILAGEIGVDCAKAAFVMRSVFAYEHGLPIRFVTENGGIIDSEREQFNTNDQHEKLILFLRKVANSLSSTSLKDNSFPLAVNRWNITPGVVYAFQMPGDHGVAGRHVFNIKDVKESGMLQLIWATVPATTRLLSERIQLPFYMPTEPTLNNQWGFRRFYQPHDYDLIANFRRSHSEADRQAIFKALVRRGFSDTDQRNIALEVLKAYEARYIKFAQDNHIDISQVSFGNEPFDFKGRAPSRLPLPQKSGTFVSDSDGTPDLASIINFYQQVLINRLSSGFAESVAEKLNRDYWNLCFYAREREVFVEEGYNYFFKQGHVVKAANQFNRCPSEEEVYDYATPSRDDEMRKWVEGTSAWYFSHRDQIKKENIIEYPIFEMLFNDGAGLTPDMKRYAQNRIDNQPINLGGNERCLVAVNMHEDSHGEPAYAYIHAWDIVDIFRRSDSDLAGVSSEPWTSIERRWAMRPASRSERDEELNPKCQVGHGGASAQSATPTGDPLAAAKK